MCAHGARWTRSPPGVRKPTANQNRGHYQPILADREDLPVGKSAGLLGAKQTQPDNSLATDWIAAYRKTFQLRSAGARMISNSKFENPQGCFNTANRVLCAGNTL